MQKNDLNALASLVRYHILTSTTKAGSGHPSSSLSATDVMTQVFFKYLRFDLDHPENPTNDRVIFSKGHAAPLLYALYAAAGAISSEEILKLREMTSPLEGHPTPHFKYAEAATGSLGQGLSIGVGMAMNAKFLDKLPYRTYVLLGDGEMAEGSVWEAAAIADYYDLDNLIAIVDVNRMGQSQETMHQHDTAAYAEKLRAFGWEVSVIDGHAPDEISKAFDRLIAIEGKPKAIVAKTFKGKGVSFLEDKPNWHGKAVPEKDLPAALAEIGTVDTTLKGMIPKPEGKIPPTPLFQRGEFPKGGNQLPPYKLGEVIATRKVYGEALARLVAENPAIVALDGDTKNSTFSEIVLQKYPGNFFEMFIAEQNMIGVAAGLAKRGKIPFVSTFSAFLTRAFDQVRMAAVSRANIKCVGSHCGVSIGEDGASQMGLEDLAMFRAVHGSTVLYPSDAVSAEYLVREAAALPGIVYIRTNRPATPVLYPANEKFPVGGSKTLKSSPQDKVTVVAAGVTLNEALAAYDILAKEGISIRVIDAYSVKPIDQVTLLKAAKETGRLIVVEDHWFEGGLGDAVLNAVAENPVPVHKLAVTQMPRSGKPAELLDWAGISAKHIVKKVKELI
ncbi:MAG: transketolase [Deltaproteobacteria bacterium]|nr:transketolase [Deltaproteobacteria bacterium]